jgi:hypothetical protein
MDPPIVNFKVLGSYLAALIAPLGLKNGLDEFNVVPMTL